MTDEPPTSVAPTSAKERILALDVLRGFALFGVFIVNASVSARPLSEVIAVPTGDSITDVAAWAILNGGFVSKFVAIFSLLFGMGLVLQCTRLEARGASPAIYLRRLGWLALFGLLHGCFLFEGDILLPYAVVGLLLFALRRRSARALIGWAVTAYALGLAFEAWGSSDLLMEDDPQLREAIERGPLSRLIRVRAITYVGWLIVSTLSMFNWQVIALFLVGALVMRAGLLGPEHLALHRRVAVAGIAVGFGLEVLTVLVGEASALARTLATLSFTIGSTVLAFGYVGAVLWAVQRGWCRGLQRALAAAGRMALTNYLTQSLLMNALFTWLGLGLYGRLSRMQVLVVVSGLFALQVAASVLWLRRHSMGPFEALWRRLTYSR